MKLKVSDGSLASVPYTIVTAVDGTRSKVFADGSSTSLPKDWMADGQFCVLDLKGEPAPPNANLALESLPEDLDITIGSPEDEPEVTSELQRSLEAMHGRLGDRSWPAPVLSVRCLDVARPGYNSGLAHEYLDSDEVLRAKAVVLAGLVRRAKRLVVYAGAGLSTASGIMDYATRTGNDGVLAKDASVPKPQPQSPYTARPNLGHRVLAAMSSSGMIWRFIQQNHDGLPQKAGVAQSVMNEIHGGWFDPSNPVVTMKGNLRDDLFKDLMECERKADLVLVLGSSLCGMNADRLVSTCAKRAVRFSPADWVLGSAIVSLQQTPHDDSSSVRIFATIDRTLEYLAEALGLEVPPPDVTPPQPSRDHRPLGPDVDVFDVPYDHTGKLALESPRQRLDLRDGAKLVVTLGPNRGDQAVVLGKNADGHYRIGVKRGDVECKGDWTDMRFMGCWWVAAAVAGEVDHFPVVSRAEQFASEA